MSNVISTQSYKLVDGKVVITSEKKVTGLDTQTQVVMERKDRSTEQTKAEYLAQLNAMKNNIADIIKEVEKL